MPLGVRYLDEGRGAVEASAQLVTHCRRGTHLPSVMCESSTQAAAALPQRLLTIWPRRPTYSPFSVVGASFI